MIHLEIMIRFRVTVDVCCGRREYHFVFRVNIYVLELEVIIYKLYLTLAYD